MNCRKWNFHNLWHLLVIVGMSTIVHADPPLPDVEGVLGLEGVAETTYLAIHVLVPENQALGAITWYNNDGGITFPQVLIGSGNPAGPGLVQEALTVAEGVNGQSLSWSEFQFSEPIGSQFPGLYLIFEFPGGCPFLAPGEGGGPAIGYCQQSENGTGGWISGDGEDWYSLDTGYAFAIVPYLVPLEEGMVMLSQLGGNGSMTPVDELFLKVGPNPGNPAFHCRFGLPAAARATVDVFNLRGERVARLLDEVLSAGHHEVTWRGRDRNGRSVASGAYFVRLQSQGQSRIKRVLLVR